MAHINLLPWREELRSEQQRQFLTILGLSVVLMILIILAVHLQISGSISYQNSRNNFIKKEIGKVEKQIKEIDDLAKAKKRLLARMDIIQQLQHNRPEIVHLFDELVRILPDGVHLTSIKQSNRALVINGIAQSNARVSAFMRNLDGSDWLANPVLDVIEKGQDNSNERKFVLRATQVSKSDENAK